MFEFEQWGRGEGLTGEEVDLLANAAASKATTGRNGEFFAELLSSKSSFLARTARLVFTSFEPFCDSEKAITSWSRTTGPTQAAALFGAAALVGCVSRFASSLIRFVSGFAAAKA